jgi:hypothetical protein
MRPFLSASLGVAALLLPLALREAHAAEAGATAAVTVNPELPPEPAPKTAAPTGGGPRANWHPRYAAEIEPHFVIAGIDKYGAGLGGGVNVTIPIWQNAPFKGFDDDIGFGIGLDWVRYAGYQPQEPRGAKVLTYALYVPVYLQWNVWLGSRASIFLEPTLMFRFARYPDTCPLNDCADTTRVMPTGSIGLRFRIVNHVAATIRVGWPLVTIGASWL